MSGLETKFFWGCGLILLAAVIFAAAVIWHDRQGQATSIAPGAASQTTSSYAAPAADLPHQTGGATAPYLGTIESVSGNNIMLAVGSGSATTTYTVEVGSNTSIYKEGAKLSDAEYQSQMQTFLAEIQGSTNPNNVYIAPDHYAHITLGISDVTAGAFVIVTPQSAPSDMTIDALSIQVGTAPAPSQ